MGFHWGSTRRSAFHAGLDAAGGGGFAVIAVIVVIAVCSAAFCIALTAPVRVTLLLSASPWPVASPRLSSTLAGIVGSLALVLGDASGGTGRG